MRRRASRRQQSAFWRTILRKNLLVAHFSTMPTPATRADVIRQLDILRGGLRIAITTIRKMGSHQKIDPAPVLRRLALMRAEAKEVRDAITRPCAAAATGLATPANRRSGVQS